MKSCLLFLICVFLAMMDVYAQSDSWQYLGQAPPKNELAIFNVSSMLNERDLAISPDGKEIYYTVTSIGHGTQTIVWISYEKGQWGTPQIASFSGKYKDIEPTFSYNGKRLYFSSNRPLNVANKTTDYNIWYVERQEQFWSDPISVGEVINTEADEFYPSLAKNGNLYFTASYKNAKGKEDIYCAKWEGNAYQPPMSLTDSINSAGYEFNAFVAPDESYLVFTAYGRQDDMGGGDLYLSTKNARGEWTKARHLGKTINSNKIDYCPYISRDRKYLFFTSERQAAPTSEFRTYQDLKEKFESPQNGLGDIYWIEISVILK